MTFQFSCSNCGTPLKTVTFKDYARICHRTNSSDYTFLEYVIMTLEGKCPVCGHKLRNPPVNVEVTPKLLEVSKKQ